MPDVFFQQLEQEAPEAVMGMARILLEVGAYNRLTGAGWDHRQWEALGVLERDALLCAMQAAGGA